MHGPGVKPGQVVEGLAESIDLVPTLLDHVGLATAGALDGNDLDDPVRGHGTTTGTEEVLSATRYGRSHKVRITTPDWVYIRNYEKGRRHPRGRRELYRGDDTWQDEPVGSEFPDGERQMADRLEAMRATYERRVISWEAPATAEDIEQLRALGYVDD